MAKKTRKKNFVCTACGAVAPKWQGRCDDCSSWNTIVEDTEGGTQLAGAEKPAKIDRTKIIPITGQIETGVRRLTTGLPVLDRVLGGGIVAGSIGLIAGEPGVGKSTLILEIARRFTGKVFYFSGEESTGQIRLRAERLGAIADHIYVFAETDASVINRLCRTEKPDLVFIDSVQTVYHPNLSYSTGSVSQVRELAVYFMELAKSSGIPVFLIGHITKDGQIAGPKILEHIVDLVLNFEGDNLNYYRLLRARKNRFGPVGEIDIFEMTASGLTEIVNTGLLFVDEEALENPGACYAVTMEGTRALCLEVQALVTRAPFSNPRRVAEGFDGRRLTLLAAVLDKHLSLNLSERDIFVNIAGGLQVSDPALDLAVVMAVLSSLYEKVIPPDTAFLGEVGLGGEVRAVNHIDARLKELTALGLKKIILPRPVAVPNGMQTVIWRNISDAAAFFPNGAMAAKEPPF